jgi:hypothetical protein
VEIELNLLANELRPGGYLFNGITKHESLDGVQIRRVVAGLPLDDNGSPSDSGVQQELPAVKEPSSKPLKPILPPITGGTPAPA